MLEAIRRAISLLRQKQILHKLGVVISIAVIAVACYVLYHMLRGIDSNQVIEAIKGTEPRQIWLAALFVAAGYFTLTFYDWFAVRAIGHREVPYHVNALAAFTSYSIGHNVGASVFTGGAVRYRIYSAWGLNAIDVAKICFLAGLTFWPSASPTIRKPRPRSISCRPGSTASRRSPSSSRWSVTWSGSGPSRAASAADRGR